MEIKVIGVLGAGTMGNGIAQVAAQAGYNVIMRDIEDRFVDNGLKAVGKFLAKSVEKRGLAYEKDFYGQKGGFTGDDFLVGYRETQPCPVCSTRIEKIKTGSTSTYICPKCQK